MVEQLEVVHPREVMPVVHLERDPPRLAVLPDALAWRTRRSPSSRPSGPFSGPIAAEIT